MTRIYLRLWPSLLLLAIMIPSALPGQSSNTFDSTVPSPRHRLPNYYGQLGITDQQRDRIYTLQAEYNSQIEELQVRIDDLKLRRAADVEAVLTGAQKRLLEDRREQARLARAARLAARRD